MSSLIFTASSCFLTIILPQISTVLSILGGIGCVTLCFIVPLIAYLTVLNERKFVSYISIAVASVLVAIGFGSCVNAIFAKVWP